MFRIVEVFDVTVGKLPHRLTSIFYDFVVDITGVLLMEQDANWHQLVFATGIIDGVRYRHQGNVVLWEKFLGQSANLYVVKVQDGKVFDK